MKKEELFRPPLTGQFLSTKRVLFNFLWATGWFGIVFVSLLAFELTRVDPLRLSISNEPDGVQGLTWWRQTVSHVMLTTMRRSTTSSAAAAAASSSRKMKTSSSSSSSSSLSNEGESSNNEVQQRTAIASQSLLVMKESSVSGRPDGALPLDPNLGRSVWATSKKSHYAVLQPFFRLVDYVLNLGGPSAYPSSSSGEDGGDDDNSGDDTSSSSNAISRTRHRKGGRDGRVAAEQRSYADARMPSQCGSFVFVDGGSNLGSRRLGGFSVSSPSSSSSSSVSSSISAKSKNNKISNSLSSFAFNQKNNNDDRALFESFVYCGNKRDSPTEIGRRIDEYFKSCVNPNSRRRHQRHSSSSSSSSSHHRRRHHNRNHPQQQQQHDNNNNNNNLRRHHSSYHHGLNHPKIHSDLLLLVNNSSSSRNRQGQAQQEESEQQSQHLQQVDCISPGLMTLLLLHRRIFSLDSVMDRSRVAFFDLGAGSEIISTIATSALHGYRQSARLARTRKFERDIQKRRRMNHGVAETDGKYKRSFDNPFFVDTVLAPPALVVSVEVASDYNSPLETSRISQIPSNLKLLSGTSRNDFKGTDPDRVKTLPITAAVANEAYYSSSSTSSSSSSVFFIVRTSRLKDKPRALNVLGNSNNNNKDKNKKKKLNSKDSNDGESNNNFRTLPRVFQCLIRQEEELYLKLDGNENMNNNNNNDNNNKKKKNKNKKRSNEDDAALDRARNKLNSILNKKGEKDRDAVGEEDEGEEEDADDVNLDNEMLNKRNNKPGGDEILINSKRRSQQQRRSRIRREHRRSLLRNKKRKFLTRDQWNSISDSQWYGRLSPHLDLTPSIPFRGPYHEEHYVRMHPTPLLRILDQAEQWSKGSTEGEIIEGEGRRAVQETVAVAFADVGGHDANVLDCGLAVSQAEMIESIQDTFEQEAGEGKNSNDRRRKKRLHDVVVVLRPLSASGTPHVIDDHVPASTGGSSGRRSIREEEQEAIEEDLNSAAKNSRVLIDKEQNWCYSCNEREAVEIVDRTLDALFSMNSMIISGCSSSSSSSSSSSNVINSNNFVSMKEESVKKEGNQQQEQDETVSSQQARDTVRSYLLHRINNNNNNEDSSSSSSSSNGGGSGLLLDSPFCTIWISSSNDQRRHIPSLEELIDLQIPLQDRQQDDKKSNVPDLIKTAIFFETEEEDAEASLVNSNNNKNGDDENNGGGYSTSSLLLLSVAIGVAFFLIRGVMRNFRSGGSGSKEKK